MKKVPSFSVPEKKLGRHRHFCKAATKEKIKVANGKRLSEEVAGRITIKIWG